ncbi:MAG TPA: glycogen debranching enzyme GlgX [Aurantimonas coralicida]|uniref:Glycosyl hydrolase family 13 catalytic domain-containing protein n=1 Tax=marine sediment metagenome TaxID=412755 RepID=A0A0F9SMF8_9ZZZZ|nr:glycogen debranching enzyme GlgX [Aurantimonas coralicida]
MSNTITAERGAPASLGATIDDGGVHFAVYSENADEIHVCLFDEGGTQETDRIPLPGRDGGTRFGFVPGLAAGTRYGLRAVGPYKPEEGHRFDYSKFLVDPYAVQLDRPFTYRPALTAPPERQIDSAPFLPRAIVTAPDRDAKPLPFANPGLTYELLVRAYSQRHPDVPAEIRGTVAALAEPYFLDHLQKVGIDTVELMPLAAWIDEGHLLNFNLTNAWGYNPITHMAPDPRLAPGGFAEIRKVVEAMHARGIRVLLDVVFNHSGEGSEEGPTICYRGLDNLLYYRHPEGEPEFMLNDTGTGNTMATHKEPVAKMFIDVLRTWVQATGIDGFRYDLGTVLGRLPEGFSHDAPFFKMVEKDDVLKDRIHVGEPWDVGPGGYQVGNFPKPWFEWQDKFRDDVRKFWKGEAGMIGALATRLAGSADLYNHDGRLPSAGVNFIAAHDGFTLADIAMYEDKHNEANGEDNRDGHNDNHSWNNGVEGETDDPAVIDARGKDIRAMLASLLVARGTPMIVAGDEFGRTQGGNNNGYAQDNEITWLDWDNADEGLIEFTGKLAKLRREHPALNADRFLTGELVEGGDVEDVIWLREDGHAMEDDDWNDPERRFVGMSVYSPKTEADSESERAVIYVNGSHEDVAVTLPEPREGHVYCLHIQSDWPQLEPRRIDHADGVVVQSRSVFIMLEEQDDGEA